MRSVVTMSVAVGLLFVIGCSQGAGTGDDREPVEPTLDFAQSVKSMIMGIKNAEEGALGVAIDSFLENYAEYQSEPLGDHKATYDGIAKAAEELKSLKDGGAGDAELMEKVDELVELSNQLPGEAAE